MSARRPTEAASRAMDVTVRRNRGGVPGRPPAAHAVHQVAVLAEIGVERPMGVRRQGAHPPVRTALCCAWAIMAAVTAETAARGRALVGPLAVQSAELAVDHQLAAQQAQVVLPGLGSAPGAAAHRPCRPDRVGGCRSSLVVAGDEIGQQDRLAHLPPAVSGDPRDLIHDHVALVALLVRRLEPCSRLYMSCCCPAASGIGYIPDAQIH